MRSSPSISWMALRSWTKGVAGGEWHVAAVTRALPLVTFFTPSVACHNLTEQSNFPPAARNEFPAFGNDVRNRPAAFLAARGRHNAKRAVLVAALHDADKRRHGSFRAAVEQMLADGGFALSLGGDVYNFFALAGEQFVQVFRRAMKFLRAEHQIHIRQFINQFLAPALRHAAHE